MAKGEMDDPSIRAEAVVGAGRGGLILAMAGVGWLGWGLGEAKLFGPVVGAAFGFIALILWASSIFTLRKGRILRRQYPASSTRRSVWRPFSLVVLLEVLLLACALVLANRIHRPDLWTECFAMVVGLHYLPLARIFRAPILGVLGVSISLWCVLCWALFRSHALVISVAIGTGILLCAASAATSLRARSIALSLS